MNKIFFVMDWLFWKVRCVFYPHRYLPTSSPPYRVFRSQCGCGHINPHPENDPILAKVQADSERQELCAPFVFIAYKLQWERTPKDVESFWADHWGRATAAEQEIMWMIYRDMTAQTIQMLELLKARQT